MAQRRLAGREDRHERHVRMGRRRDAARSQPAASPHERRRGRSDRLHPVAAARPEKRRSRKLNKETEKMCIRDSASIDGPFDPEKFGIEERAIRTGRATLPNSAPNRSRPISKEARGQRKACLKSSPPENAFGIAHGRAHPAQQDFVALGLRNAPRHAARPQPRREQVKQDGRRGRHVQACLLYTSRCV